MMQETAPDQQHIREAVEARDGWRQQVDDYQKNRPLSAKRGLRKPRTVKCRTDSQTMRLQDGLDAAEARLAAAATKREALRDVPAIWRKAVEYAEKHNAPICRHRLHARLGTRAPAAPSVRRSLFAECGAPRQDAYAGALCGEDAHTTLRAAFGTKHRAKAHSDSETAVALGHSGTKYVGRYVRHTEEERREMTEGVFDA